MILKVQMRRKKIKSSWLDYLNFSTRERRGAAFLSLIICVQIIVLVYLRNYESPITPVNPLVVKKILALNSKNSNGNFKEINNIIRDFKLVSFDPNKIDSGIGVTVGLSNKQTKSILNYLSKGGVFRTKKDFRKMYCIPEHQFKMLEPFLLLPDSIIRSEKKKFERKNSLIDIGSADSMTLLQIRGIGPVFASRIIKYREKLGGFVSIEQLKEVYGMKDSTFNVINSFMILKDSIPFRFVNINSDSTSVLATHPYIRWKLAGIISSYRNQHPFTSVSEILSLPLITEENFRKLAPYIKTN